MGSALDFEGTAHLVEKTLSYVNEHAPIPTKGFLTWAQYNALSEKEKSDGFYAIVGDSVSAGNSTMEIYDDEERVIGTWFGKPLYRKCYTVSFTHESLTTKSVALGSFQGFNLISACGDIRDGLNGEAWGPLTYLIPKAEYYNSQMLFCDIIKDKNENLLLRYRSNTESSSIAQAIVFYTKTNDDDFPLTGSTSIGQEVYSTEEARIGTWIDGKPLYQISYIVNTGAAKSTPVQAIPIEFYVVDIYGFLIDSSDSHVPVSSSCAPNRSGVFTNGGYLYFDGDEWYSNCSAVITIKYTKTTD